MSQRTYLPLHHFVFMGFCLWQCVSVFISVSRCLSGYVCLCPHLSLCICGSFVALCVYVYVHVCPCVSVSFQVCLCVHVCSFVSVCVFAFPCECPFVSMCLCTISNVELIKVTEQLHNMRNSQHFSGSFSILNYPFYKFLKLLHLEIIYL